MACPFGSGFPLQSFFRSSKKDFRYNPSRRFELQLKNQEMNKIQQALQNRILILDGAMGTMLQRYKFSEEDFLGERFKDFHKFFQGNNDLLSTTLTQVPVHLLSRYAAARADTVDSNTFSSRTIAMADSAMQALAYELNAATGKPAKKVADEFAATEPKEPRCVARAMGP